MKSSSMDASDDSKSHHSTWVDSYHIPQKHGTYDFEIRDWSLVPHGTGEPLLGSQFSVGALDLWQISLYPGGMDRERSGRVTVVVRNLGNNQVRASCELHVLTNQGHLESFAKSDNGHTFEAKGEDKDSWVVDMPISYEDTIKDGCNFIADNTLKVMAEINVCGFPTIVPGDSTCGVIESECTTLGKDMQFLLDETNTAGMKSDVVLASGEERVPCHQCILCARSPVFREMFKAPATGMKLMLHAGKLYTSKIEPCVLEEFVHFIYTDQCRFDLLQGHQVMALFAAGSKYKIRGLISACQKALIQSLSVENVSDVISMAQQWENVELTSACLSFIGGHTVEVMKTEGFKQLDADICRMVVEEVTFPAGSEAAVEADNSSDVLSRPEGQEEVKLPDDLKTDIVAAVAHGSSDSGTTSADGGAEGVRGEGEVAGGMKNRFLLKGKSKKKTKADKTFVESMDDVGRELADGTKKAVSAVVDEMNGMKEGMKKDFSGASNGVASS